jgi:hypothetical protein
LAKWLSDTQANAQKPLRQTRVSSKRAEVLRFNFRERKKEKIAHALKKV